MRSPGLIAFVAAVVAIWTFWLTSTQIYSEEAGNYWSSLDQQARAEYYYGNYDRAVEIGKKALSAAEEKNAPEVPDALVKLGAYYGAQADFASAEPLLRRALTIREKTLGPDHPDVANSLNSLASLYYHQSKYREAEVLLKRASAIRSKTRGIIESCVLAE